jgi:hypothetical protein
MKRIICLILLLSMCLSVTACGDGESHIGEAKTPSGSSAMKGRDYQDVIENFKEKGFTNIRTEKIEDLIAGWLTKDGEVEEVSVGGDVEYSPDKWLPADTEVLIKYHTFPSNEEDSSWTEKDDSSKQPFPRKPMHTGYRKHRNYSEERQPFHLPNFSHWHKGRFQQKLSLEIPSIELVTTTRFFLHFLTEFSFSSP